MTAPWNGHPLMNADRDGWHLLRFERREYPEPYWWDCRSAKWLAGPKLNGGMPARLAEISGYTYVAGMVTPEEWEGRSATS